MSSVPAPKTHNRNLVRREPITIRDVAAASGVSVTTVSFVLNNGPRPVSAVTRERVLATMRRMDYHPNAVARSMTRRSLRTLGIMFAGTNPRIVHNPYVVAVLDALFAAASPAGYNLTLFTNRWQSASVSASAYRDGRTDGVIVINPHIDSDVVDGLANVGLPVLAFAAPPHRDDVPYVDVDNDAGVRLVLDYLTGLGHRRIAHIGGPTHYAHAQERREAFVSYGAEHGLVIPPEFLLSPPDGGWGMHPALIADLLRLPHRPTALVAHNDATAVDCVRVCHELGLSVPGDVSVVGFDDTDIAATTVPPLTTVRQPYLEMGKAAIRLLVASVEGTVGSADMVCKIAPELMVRQSTAAPPVH